MSNKKTKDNENTTANKHTNKKTTPAYRHMRRREIIKKIGLILLIIILVIGLTVPSIVFTLIGH